VEVFIDYGLTNIVAAQYDAGIRPGRGWWPRTMIAVRIGRDLRMAVVASPSYFAYRKKLAHASRTYRTTTASIFALPTHGGSLYAWDFEKTRTRTERSRRRTARLQRRKRTA